MMYKVECIFTDSFPARYSVHIFEKIADAQDFLDFFSDLKSVSSICLDTIDDFEFHKEGEVKK